MSDRKRTAESNVGAFFGGVVQVSLPIPAIGVESQPSEPRPEDEWTVPAEPVHTVGDESVTSLKSEPTIETPPSPTPRK